MKKTLKREKPELMIGGQAVIEGVMMRTKDSYAIAVRTGKNRIIVKKEKFTSITKRHKILGLPLIRGAIMLYETMLLGIKSLNFSAAADLDDEEEKKSLDKGLFATFILSTIFALALFKFLPLIIASYFQKVSGAGNLAFNVVDGVAKLAILLGYMGLIGLLPDVKRLFQYHGAEHMAVACFEKKKSLTPENVRHCRKEHPRCGTSFIIFVLLLSIIFYMFIPLSTGFWAKFGLRVLFLPVIAGLSYELIRLAGKHDNVIIKILVSPGMVVQKITTRDPDNAQIEVAIKSLKEVLKN